MAEHGREQRDRAVDLYIKYEHSAADTIRELGYPSRGALWMWYKDRLEEERTGVPSRRGEWYRRYSDEQRQAAVDHYLEYGRRPGRTMRMLGYPKSKELLTAWIDEPAPGRRKPRHGPVPEESKRKAVVAVASGRLKSREAAAELGVEPSVVGKPEATDARQVRGGDCGRIREKKDRHGIQGAIRQADRGPKCVGRGGVHGGQTRAIAGPSGRAGREHRGQAADRTRARHPDRDPVSFVK